MQRVTLLLEIRKKLFEKNLLNTVYFHDSIRTFLDLTPQGHAKISQMLGDLKNIFVAVKIFTQPQT